LHDAGHWSETQMKRVKPRKSKSPESRSELARKAALARWEGTTKQERSDHASRMGRSPRTLKRPRCPCGVMTLKRAKERGLESVHKRTPNGDWCPFYCPPRRKGE
jgi:hypothetical protein